MKRTATALGFDIYFRSSYARHKKRSGTQKRHPAGAKGTRSGQAIRVRISDIKDDEMSEPPVTPKDERKIWD